jgi:hypothetical protein
MLSPCYEIRIQGKLDQDWSDWFDGFLTSQEDGEITMITVRAVDQSALFGILNRIRDLNLPLISINPKGESDE